MAVCTDLVIRFVRALINPRVELVVVVAAVVMAAAAVATIVVVAVGFLQHKVKSFPNMALY